MKIYVIPLVKPVLVDSLFLGIQTRTNVSVNIMFYILIISLCKTSVGWIFPPKAIHETTACTSMNFFLSLTKHKQFKEYLITMYKAQWKVSKWIGCETSVMGGETEVRLLQQGGFKYLTAAFPIPVRRSQSLQRATLLEDKR